MKKIKGYVKIIGRLGGNKMSDNINKKEFQQIINHFYQQMTQGESVQDILLDYDHEKLKQLDQYVLKNYETLNLIHIERCVSYRKKIILETTVGIFLLDKPMDLNSKKRMESLNHDNLNILEFYGIISNNDFGFSLPKYDTKIKIKKNYYKQDFLASKNIITDFLIAYFHCRMIQESEKQKQLFISFNKNNSNFQKNRSIPLECLNHPNYHDFTKTNEEYAKELQNIYDNYYQFSQNQALIFTFIIFNHDLTKIDYIKKNLEEFKKFVIKKASKKMNTNKYIYRVYDYLVDSGIRNLFTKEDLQKMYQMNVSYWNKDKSFFSGIAHTIKNTSPMIRLSRKDEKKVHIRYLDYDLYEETPAKILANAGNQKFLNTFLMHNKTIVKLYQRYYKNYQKAIDKTPEKDNLYDFIQCMLSTNNLLKIYDNPNFSIQEVKALISFGTYYDKKTQQNIEMVQEFGRRRSITIYNTIVKYQNNTLELESILNRLNLNKNTIYSFIIEDKFLFAIEKEGVLNILNDCFPNSIRLFDILSIIDEANTREISLYEMLKEKEISSRVFNGLSENVWLRNSNTIKEEFEKKNQKIRKRYLNALKIGYQVLDDPTFSSKKYEEQFSTYIDFYELLSYLEGTELEQPLMEKAFSWPDEKNTIYKKMKKNK